MNEMMTAMMAAMLIYHVVHSIMELRGVKYKINKLEADLSKRPFKEKSFKMDSIPKMMLMMMGMMVMFLAIPMYLMVTLGLEVMTMVQISIVLIVVIEIINYVGYNSYHGKVAHISSRIKK